MLPLLLVAGLGVWMLLPQVRADIDAQHKGLARAIAGQVEAHLLGAGRELSALAAYLATTANPRRAFQDLFAVAVERWLSGEFDEDYAESWPSFQQRCWKGLHQIIEQAGPSQDIWVFTSGGPITAIAQQLLTIPDSHIFNLNWSLVNAGVTRLLYSGNRLSLSYLNNHAHLEQHRRADLVTYR